MVGGRQKSPSQLRLAQSVSLPQPASIPHLEGHEPPASEHVSFPSILPFEQEPQDEVLVTTSKKHKPESQSVLVEQDGAGRSVLLHGAQVEPPQSVEVSSPFFESSEQLKHMPFAAPAAV
jgi:hypothetical protein